MADLPFRMIDAFAETAFEGNNAGVVLGADELRDDQMQRIAREVNAAETAFLYQPDAAGVRRLRWFTPACEVEFCGHATLAAAEALRLSGALTDDGVVFDGQIGRLRLSLEQLLDDWIWWLEVPTPTLHRANLPDQKVATMIGGTSESLDPELPPQQTSSGDLLVFVKTWQTLQQLTPEMNALGRWCEKHDIRGVSVSTCNTPTAGIHAASRFFAPACGIAEDPVTGSAHGPLALALLRAGRAPRAGTQAAVNCVQGIPGGRSGLVRVLMDEADEQVTIKIAGRCQATIEGTMRIPD